MTPLTYQWDGDAMVPLARFQRLANKQFVVGETYPLTIHEERSAVSHRHYFASLHDAWLNLPEAEAERFETSEHLRKWCLIKNGFRDERSIVCGSKADARRVAAFIRPMDSFAVVVVNEAVVTVYTARSQSVKAMGKVDFQRSKTAVLDTAWAMCGVSAREAKQNGGKAA